MPRADDGMCKSVRNIIEVGQERLVLVRTSGGDCIGLRLVRHVCLTHECHFSFRPDQSFSLTGSNCHRCNHYHVRYDINLLYHDHRIPKQIIHLFVEF